MNFLENETDYYWPIILGQILFALVISILLYPTFAYLSPIRQIRIDKDVGNKPASGLDVLIIYLVFFMSTIFAFILFGFTPLPISIRILALPLLILFFIDIDIKKERNSIIRKVSNLSGLLSIILFLSAEKVIFFKIFFGAGWTATGLIYLFVFLVYIIGLNALRAIDQINGLVGGLAIMANFYFGIAFILIKDFHWALISFSSLGAILGFLTLRIYHKKGANLGIGGTLFVGFIIITLSLNYFTSPNLITKINLVYDIFTVVALLCYPIVNTIRILILRLKNGWTSFEVNKNHLHNYLINLGLSQNQVALFLLSYSMLLALLMETIDSIGIYLPLSILFLFLFLLGFSPLYLVKTENGIKLRWTGIFKTPE